jgi:hypothetical protein
VESTACNTFQKTLQDCLLPSYILVSPEANIPVRSSSLPNVDLLEHGAVSLMQQSNEAEDVMHLYQEPGTADKTKTGKKPAMSYRNSLNFTGVNNATILLAGDSSIGFEPDIVQSTKSSSLNRQGTMPVPQPVAPPRKKKNVVPSPQVNSEQVFY